MVTKSVGWCLVHLPSPVHGTFPNLEVTTTSNVLLQVFSPGILEHPCVKYVIEIKLGL